MTSNLATKQDLQQLDQQLQHLDQMMVTRIEAFESRLLIKLGALMTVLLSMAVAAMALLR